MADFAKMADRIRRRIRDDGTVVDVRVPRDAGGIEVDGGRVMSLNPPRVRLRSGETVEADAYLRTGVTPSVGSDVAVVRKGSFVLVLGEVAML